MATASSSILHGTAAGNAFVTSTKPFSDMLQALVTAGVLTQTADTGQVSWGGVSASNSTVTYYEIFKLNDSLNGSFPLYMKFSYVPNATTTFPTSITMSIGTGSDGAGNITGGNTAVTVRGGVPSAAAVDLVARSCWASAGDGYLNLFGGINPTVGGAGAGGFLICIERLRNSSGTSLGDGVSVIMAAQYNATSVASVATTGTALINFPANAPYVANHYASTRANLANLFASSNNVWPPISNKGASYWSTPQYDGTNYLAAAVQPYAGKVYSAGIGFLIGDSIFPAMSTMTLTLYTVAHTYQTLNTNIPVIMPGNTMNMNAVNAPTSAMSPVMAIPLIRFE